MAAGGGGGKGHANNTSGGGGGAGGGNGGSGGKAGLGVMMEVIAAAKTVWVWAVHPLLVILNIVQVEMGCGA